MLSIGCHLYRENGTINVLAVTCISSYANQGGATGWGGGGHGGNCPARRSVMNVDDDNTPHPLWKIWPQLYFSGRKNVLGPRPPPRLSDLFSGLMAQHRSILPPLTKHPGAAPDTRSVKTIFCFMIFVNYDIIWKFRWKNVILHILIVVPIFHAGGR